jgi:hypothetical protein
MRYSMSYWLVSCGQNCLALFPWDFDRMSKKVTEFEIRIGIDEAVINQSRQNRTAGLIG